MVAQEVLDQYEPTIGIECHVQLKTKTKLFSGANNDAREAAPNTTVSPLCFGLPGTLPVLNQEAVTLAVRAGVALNADIAEVSRFDRKHYFYPDLPKGYQITQLEQPTVGKGWIEVPVATKLVRVGITRAHIEEDAGKLTHPEGADYSLVDLNRAGTPLIEIVSEADMHSAEEAKAYAQELYLLMKYAGVTEGDLYHGNMRFDVNISVTKKGAKQWGTRAEVKNLNSFKSVERAADYEFKRQIELLEKGEKIVQETRGWHDAKQKTFSQRSKEDTHDYRYFPDADLPPITLTNQEIEDIKLDTPILPPQLRTELSVFSIATEVANTLIMADASGKSQYVNTVLEVGKAHGGDAAVFVAHFIVNRFGVFLQDHSEVSAMQLPSVVTLGEAFVLRKNGELSANAAETVLLEHVMQSDKSVKDVAQQLGLLQENNLEAVQKIVDEVLTDVDNGKAVADVQAGRLKVLGYLVGQVMKKSKGKANPALAQKLIREKLSE